MANNKKVIALLSYLLRRLLLIIPTLLGITLIAFATMVLSPGGIGASLVDGNLKPKERAAVEAYYNQRFGLNQPAPVQYLRWLNNTLPMGFTQDAKGNYTDFSFTKGIDLGISLNYNRPVADILAERLPITLLLNVVTIPIIYIVAIVVGVRAAEDRGGRFDLASNVSMLVLWSIPPMLAGVLLIGFFANSQHLQWFPASGLSSREAQDMPFLPHWASLADVLKVFVGLVLGMVSATLLSRLMQWRVWGFALSLSVGALAGIGIAMQFASDGFVRGFLLDRLWHLILPVICLSYGGFAVLAKLTRASILENLYSDYARTARAKGLDEQKVMWRHVFRNSLLPLITVSAGLLPSLLSGSVIVENIFSINGMGQLAVEAVQFRDRELVLAITWISGLLTLLGYLIADFFYTLADPRVSYE